jgi:dTMP kinase
MFITFEGIEGSGKSLQIDRTVAHLKRRGVRCLVTREPGGTEFGSAVRQILLRAGGPPRDPLSELLLYLADRHQHLCEVIEPALRDGVTVISDRYHDATRAYQGAARGIAPGIIDRLAAVLGIRDPDKTILLDIDPLVGLQRARSRNESSGSALEEGRFEAEDLSFHREVRKAYLALARQFPQRIHRIDASGSSDAVYWRIQVLLDEWFPPAGDS